MNKLSKLAIVLLGLFSSAPVFAQTEGNPLAVMATYMSIGGLVIATGLVVGFATVISGIMHFKNSAHDRLRFPIAEGVSRLLAGVAMLAMPAVYFIVKTSFFTGGDTSWSSNMGNDAIALSKTIQQSEAVNNSVMSIVLTEEMKAIIFGLLWLIGIIFIFMGIFKLKSAGSSGSQNNGSIKDGIVQIVGGVALMNPMITLCLFLGLGPTEFMCQ